MNKLLSVIYLSIFFVFSSCAITMSGPFDGQSDSLPLVYKVNLEKSDISNFIMVCEAVDGVDDATLEEMKNATMSVKKFIEPDLDKDNFYLVFDDTKYETGIFIIEYTDTGSFIKFMDVDLKTGIASNYNKSVSITSEFYSDNRTVIISMVEAGIEGFYVSKDESFLFEKQSSSKLISVVQSQIFKTKDGVNYTLNGEKRIDTASLEFDASSGYVPYAIFYYDQENSPFNISSDLVLLIFNRPTATGFELCFIQVYPEEDKFMTIRNYPEGVNTVIEAKVASDYETILLTWKWLHVF